MEACNFSSEIKDWTEFENLKELPVFDKKNCTHEYSMPFRQMQYFKGIDDNIYEIWECWNCGEKVLFPKGELEERKERMKRLNQFN